MKYDDRILHDCDCDFGTDNKIKSDDVYILNSAIRYANKQESSTEIDITRLCQNTEDSKLTIDVSYLSPKCNSTYSSISRYRNRNYMGNWKKVAD